MALFYRQYNRLGKCNNHTHKYEINQKKKKKKKKKQFHKYHILQQLVKDGMSPRPVYTVEKDFSQLKETRTTYSEGWEIKIKSTQSLQPFFINKFRIKNKNGTGLASLNVQIKLLAHPTN